MRRAGARPERPMLTTPPAIRSLLDTQASAAAAAARVVRSDTGCPPGLRKDPLNLI